MLNIKGTQLFLPFTPHFLGDDYGVSTHSQCNGWQDLRAKIPYQTKSEGLVKETVLPLGGQSVHLGSKLLINDVCFCDIGQVWMNTFPDVQR